ncbi:MAG TPA: antibiotic ABC transporter ATP-binding protein [Porphyromonadaceae bacterium]|nr:antibiotic ABC transporter ATP-binding protein [Porphyromonadaceae bacterium]
MKDFFSLLRRFALPYKWNVLLSILFNLLTAFLTIFSFAFIMPILKMLFRIDTTVYHYMELGSGNFKEVIFNNFYYYVQTVIDSSGASVALATLAAMLVVMTLLKTGASYLSMFFMVPLRNGVVRDIRNQMYAKILSLPIGFFTDTRKGDVMARLSGDVQEVEASVMSSLDMLFKNPILIVVYLATMFFFSWQLTIFVLILLPLAGLVMGRVGKSLKRKSLRAQQLWGTILSTAEESIGGLRVIKAFNAERHMERKFTSETQSFFSMSNAIARRNSLAHPMSEFLGTTAIAIVLWFGGALILSGDSAIDAPTFILYMVIFYSIINPAKDLSKATYTIQKGMAAMQRIDAILMADNPIKSPADAVHTSRTEARHVGVEFRDVCFSYTPDRLVLDHISLEIKPGSTVAIVGQSGSGKSTLVDLVPRFWDVDSGSVIVGGVDVRRYDVTDLRDLMGNVNQEAILFNDTFYNNITFGMEEVTREMVEEAARIANAHDFIMASPEGYDTNIGDRGCRLSGGQRQRLSIARAILKNPPVLILDEATSALDTESERLVQEALERLMRDRTTIVIAHRLSTIVGADMICVMDRGRIVECGTHSQLLAKNGHYRRLVDMQQV